MDSPEKLLKEAHRSLFSEGDAIRAQQILNRILKEFPESPQAKRAEELQEMLCSAPTRGESYSESSSDRAEGCREAIFRTLAAIIGICGIAAVVAAGTSIELDWRAVAGGSLLLAGALFFLDIGLSGGRFLFAPIMFSINRGAIGRYRYFYYALGIGLFILVGVLVAKRLAEKDGSPDGWMAYALVELIIFPLIWLVLSLLDNLFPPRK